MRKTSKLLWTTSFALVAASTSATAQTLPVTAVADPALTYLVIGTSPTLGANNCFGTLQFCVRPAGIDVNYFATAAEVAALRGQLAATNNRVDQAFQSIQQNAARFQQASLQADRGIAAVAAMANISMPSSPGRTTWALNGSTFQSEFGGGMSFAHRLNFSTPIAVTAAYGNGGGSAHVGRVGLMGEF